MGTIAFLEILCTSIAIRVTYFANVENKRCDVDIIVSYSKRIVFRVLVYIQRMHATHKDQVSELCPFEPALGDAKKYAAPIIADHFLKLCQIQHPRSATL